MCLGLAMIHFQHLPHSFESTTPLSCSLLLSSLSSRLQYVQISWEELLIVEVRLQSDRLFNFTLDDGEESSASFTLASSRPGNSQVPRFD